MAFLCLCILYAFCVFLRLYIFHKCIKIRSLIINIHVKEQKFCLSLGDTINNHKFQRHGGKRAATWTSVTLRHSIHQP